MPEGVLDHQDLLVKKASQVKMAFLGQQDKRENQVNQALESQDLLDSQDFLVHQVQKVLVDPLEMEVSKERGEIQAHLGSQAYLV